ncbi:hypothetical protein [Butyrivibrio proteoclasticus]|uniref:hypothetical protein n=1 Tax=Butyrivibrio proteoclasticus TaxID=43305 RepID=UPI00047C2741|nr:hypothetical protein [Butyrivibrio proteoclasticus]
MKKGGFCRFYKGLYWGESVKNHTLVKMKLYHGSGQFGIYLVTRAQCPSDQLDIIHCAFLKQKIFRELQPLVYGIAGSHEEAVGIVLRISQEASIAGLDGQLVQYLDGRDS